MNDIAWLDRFKRLRCADRAPRHVIARGHEPLTGRTSVVRVPVPPLCRASSPCPGCLERMEGPPDLREQEGER